MAEIDEKEKKAIFNFTQNFFQKALKEYAEEYDTEFLDFSKGVMKNE